MTVTSKVSSHWFLEDLEYENTMYVGPNFLHVHPCMHTIWDKQFGFATFIRIVHVVKSCDGIWFFTLQWQLLNVLSSTRMQLHVSLKKMY